MNREIITIAGNGVVTVPNEARMNIYEIAVFFGISFQTAKRYVREIEKTSVVRGDYAMGGTVEGLKVSPDYYGLEMIIAVAFRLDSPQSQLFRRWVVHKMTTAFSPLPTTLFIRLSKRVLDN